MMEEGGEEKEGDDGGRWGGEGRGWSERLIDRKTEKRENRE